MRTGAEIAILATEAPKWTDIGSLFVAMLALITASAAARATIRTNRSQSKQLQRLEKSQASELASKFGVWMSKELAKEHGDSEALTVGYIRYFFHYQNSGFLPIYGLIVECRKSQLLHPTEDTHPYRWTFEGVGPTNGVTTYLGGQDNRFHEAVRQEAIQFKNDRAFQDDEESEPSATFYLRKAILARLDFDQIMDFAARTMQLSYFFTDGNGLHWHRSHDGTLSQLQKAGDLSSALDQKTKADKRRDRKRRRREAAQDDAGRPVGHERGQAPDEQS
ncbi:hypothetical protein [Amycolatopsis sp. 195334CR]|uniref:hypothetical protein n=1 Tax=Amycolatopsis sp. 195334CR TaxID=2814588 RepID=UPI001A8C26AC|nr:hypothetical protein [Amycolatopsis sp. 195334CR]MBN6034080.1 hypothetical protein [Amycolatopsis sp. 195334CR]